MFRQEAKENQGRKWEGQALLLKGTPVWFTTSLCMIFLMLMMIFLIFGSYSRRVNVTGEITSQPRSINVYSGYQGFIAKQYVQPGQTVQTGDPLYQLDISRSTSDGILSNNKRKEIEAQIGKVESIILKLSESKSVTIESLKKQRDMYVHAWSDSTEILRVAKQGMESMKTSMNNYAEYQKKGLITKDQLSYQRSVYYSQQNSLLTLSQQNAQNSLEISNLESQLQTQSADFDNRIYQMELQRYDLQKELLNANADGNILVKALSDGTIDSLSVTVGQMVNQGDSLAQIIPGEISGVVLVVWVPNDSLPYIKIDDKVNIRYDAFPYQKFGQFSGKILNISKVPASPKEMQTYAGAPKNGEISTTPYYKVIIQPEVTNILYHGKKLNLDSGMLASTTLFLENRKIYQWMLSPFYDMQNSLMTPVNER